jgi:signal transduction histidine kinase/CheY-like chemotaxis protein
MGYPSTTSTPDSWRKRRNWWALPAGALFLSQLVLLARFRQNRWELPIENVLDFCLMAIAFVVGWQASRRCRGLSRYVWRTTAICCGLFAFSLAMGFIGLFHPENAAVNALSDYISVFWLAPLSFTLFLEPDFEPGRFDPVHILDFIQIVVFWIAIYFFFLFLPTEVPQMGAHHTWLQATWAGSLVYDASMALLFFMRTLLTSSRSMRKLFARLSGYLLCAGIADFFANYYRVPSGTWYQVIWAILNIAPIVLASTWDDLEEPCPTGAGASRLLGERLFPVITAFLVLIFSMVIVRERLGLAVFMVSVSFVCSSVRLVVIQQRELRIADDLQAEIAERTRAEQRLRENEEHLEEQVASRTGELRAANQQLRAEITERQRLEEELRQTQKMEAIGTLSGGIAHDFNNLLTVIRGYARMVLDRVQADPDLRADVEQIDEAGSRAAALTSQLLTFSRRQMLQPKVIDLNSVVNDLEKMLRRLIGEHIELLTDVSHGIGNVKADPGQIEQVIMNLVVNARDAMPRGGRLVIETRNVKLDAAYAREHVDVIPGDYVMLAVHDTGTGMDEDVKVHIFEPFFTTKERARGTGLGLSTVYGIVKQSGGSIQVKSELGKGTTFEIYLPRVHGKHESMTRSAPSSVHQGVETVLLVEDDDQVRHLAQHILERCGYTVHAASNGERAKDFFGRHQGNIDLLVTDVVMPGLSGPELAEDFSRRWPTSKVLFISGYTDDAIGEHGVLQEGINLLLKPFTPATLGEKVREVLDGALLVRQ